MWTHSSEVDLLLSCFPSNWVKAPILQKGWVELATCELNVYARKLSTYHLSVESSGPPCKFSVLHRSPRRLPDWNSSFNWNMVDCIVSSLVLLVLSSCMLVGWYNCSGTRYLATHKPRFFRLAALYQWDKIQNRKPRFESSCKWGESVLICLCVQFLNSTLLGNVSVSAESVGGSTPSFRVNWNTTLPTTWVCDIYDCHVQTEWNLSILPLTHPTHWDHSD